MALAPATRDTITGALIVLGALAAVLPLGWRSYGPGAPQPKRFHLWSPVGHDVKEMSPVRMNGLQVGSVESIDISTRGNIEVHFRVEPEFAPLVRGEPHAALVEPLAGLTYVLLENGTPTAQEFPGGRVRVFTPKSFEQKLEWSMKKSEEFAAKIDPLIAKAERIAGHTEWIAKHIEDGDGVLGAMSRPGGPLAGVDRITAALGTVGRDVAEVNDAIARREGTIGRVMNPDDPIFAAAKRVAERAEETIASFDRAKARLEKASDLVTRRLERAIGSVRDVPGILADAKAVASEVAMAADKATRKIGTIGRFMNDADFVGDLRRWVDEIARSSDSSDNPLVNYATGLGLKTVPGNLDPTYGPEAPGEKGKN